MREVIFQEILYTLESRHWKRLLLAVSGGMDSICLADYFVQNQKRLGIEWLGISHVHHGLRGISADRDAAFVQSFAHKFNLPFFIRHLDGKALQSRGSVEENAREARYKALREMANDSAARADAILTAHHANDQAETVLMRLLRGSGFQGLGGIQSIREDGIFRPFLKVSRQELLAYAKERGLDFCEDESNADIAFDRNAIRHGLMPQLQKEFPGIVPELLKIAELSGKAFQKIALSAEAHISPFVVSEKLWPLPRAAFPDGKILSLHSASMDCLFQKSPVGGAAILRTYLKLHGFPFPRGVNFLSNFSSRDGTLLFEKSRHILWFCRLPSISKTHNLYLLNQKESLPGKWRFRMPGDVYTPVYGPSKPLRKWFEENGVPQFARDSVPLFARGRRILQIFGIPPRIKDFYE